LPKENKWQKEGSFLLIFHQYNLAALS